jgi:hypothetical protein
MGHITQASPSWIRQSVTRLPILSELPELQLYRKPAWQILSTLEKTFLCSQTAV